MCGFVAHCQKHISEWSTMGAGRQLNLLFQSLLQLSSRLTPPWHLSATYTPVKHENAHNRDK